VSLNVISGIIIIGGMFQISGPLSSPTTTFGAIAILRKQLISGFLVSQRHAWVMFQKQKESMS